MLAGKVAVRPLLSSQAAETLLDHEGVLLGRLADAWFVLIDAGDRNSNPLSDLLHPARGLATNDGPLVIQDSRAYSRLASGAFSLTEIPALLSGEEPAPEVSAAMAQVLTEHRWMTNADQLRLILNDAEIQYARSHRAELVEISLDELVADFTERNLSPPSRESRNAMRRLAEQEVDRLATRSFQMDWSVPSPRVAKQ